MTEAIIAVEHVSKRVQDSSGELTILHDIDFSLAAQESAAIVGASGSGKSTLLAIIAGLDTPSEGTVRLAGIDLFGLDEDARAAVRAERVGFVFQSFNLIDELTIEENVALGLAYRKDVSDRKAKVAAAMDRIGIAHRARHFPHQLSGGQQQRAAIARAIVGDPKLILADEPTGNLDTANGEQVMNILTTLNESGSTIVMVTHSPSHADMAKRRIDMLDGRIVASAMRAL